MSRADAPRYGAISLPGLKTAAPQTLGGLRCVPILRDAPLSGLRLLGLPSPDGAPPPWRDDDVLYRPNAYIADWTPEGGEATLGARLLQARELGKIPRPHPGAARVAKAHQRRPGEGRSLTILPLPMALEGLLIHQQRGPEIAWGIYNRRAWQGVRGAEAGFSEGEAVRCLDLALRRFEVHGDQVGMALFGAGRLLGVSVAPHPEDYRRLHRALLGDLFRSPVLQFGALYADEPPLTSWDPGGPARDLGDLRRALDQMRAAWHAEAQLEGESILGRPVRSRRVYRLGPFSVEGFITQLDPNEVNAVGEAILGPGGSLEHLQLFPLSRKQTRRAYLLEQLAGFDWHLGRAAEGLGATEAELTRRIANAGLGHWIHEHVRRAMGVD